MMGRNKGGTLAAFILSCGKAKQCWNIILTRPVKPQVSANLLSLVLPMLFFTTEKLEFVSPFILSFFN